MNYQYPLYNFLLVTLAYMPDESPCNVLQRSAGFCKMPVHWDYKGNRGNQVNGGYRGNKVNSGHSGNLVKRVYRGNWVHGGYNKMVILSFKKSNIMYN